MFPFECNKFTKLQYRSAASAVSLLALVVVVSLALSATAVAFYLRLRIVFSDKMIAMLPNFYFQKVSEGADIQQRPYYTSTSAIFRDKSIMRDFSALHRPVKQHFKQFWEGIVFYWSFVTLISVSSPVHPKLRQTCGLFKVVYLFLQFSASPS